MVAMTPTEVLRREYRLRDLAFCRTFGWAEDEALAGGCVKFLAEMGDDWSTVLDMNRIEQLTGVDRVRFRNLCDTGDPGKPRFFDRYTSGGRVTEDFIERVTRGAPGDTTYQELQAESLDRMLKSWAKSIRAALDRGDSYFSIELPTDPSLPEELAIRSLEKLVWPIADMPGYYRFHSPVRGLSPLIETSRRSQDPGL